MPEDTPDFTAILETLAKYDVEFVVVGGVCAVLLGAPVTTFDLDIVHARNEKNIKKLHEALRSINARYREHLPKVLTPDEVSLASPGHHLLATQHAPLDVLGVIDPGHDYVALQSDTEEISMNVKQKIKILNLEKLIETKQATGRDKDIAMLTILKALQGGRD